MLVLVYLASFAAGPAAFWVLARRKAEGIGFALMGLLALGLLLLAYLLPRLAGEAWRSWAYSDAVLLVVLWFAWIVVLALCVQGARHRLPDGHAQRWAFAIGAVATTLPWFGLLIAQGMTG